MTIDRLLVLLLSVSFLLLAPPAAAGPALPLPAPSVLSEPQGPRHLPDPAAPDETGLFLVTTPPEAPPPSGTDDGAGHALPAPAFFALSGLAALSVRVAPDPGPVAGQGCPHPWSTGPPGV